MPNLTDKHVVTCFLMHGGKILLLRRSSRVGTYQKRWAGVSGYIESTPDEQALTEIREEVCLTDVELLKKGEIVIAEDEKLGTRWIIHPYLFEVKDPAQIRLDWENMESRWIETRKIGEYETVPKLKEALAAVLEEQGTGKDI
jgi:8-oxo-dGTP diphosphatase